MRAKPGNNGWMGRLARIFNRALGSVSARLHVASANLWRDNYNPLRGLTIARAVSMLEAGERGAYAEVTWTYRYIEMQDATVGALVERRTAAIQQLDWDVKVRDDVPEAARAVAERQRAALSAAYNRIGNLTAALEFLSLASFRGFAHLELVTGPGGEVVRMEPVDQWFWVRDGLYGEWKINPSGAFGTTTGEDIPRGRFIIREVQRPIGRVALIAFIRKNLSQKDWDAYIETYGVPAVFIVMPENLPQDREDEFLDTADQVASDARGVLPGGSRVETVSPGTSGESPFRAHLDYQDEQIVMRGTGGLLTMLAESGSGTLAGGAHSDTFAAIARAEAAEISEILRDQFDRQVLARVTPGEPAWAYFELAANEETDTGAITEDVARLASAGYRVRAEWIAERTGYEIDGVTVAEDEEQPEALLNRYNPNQFRAPKGTTGGGRWAKMILAAASKGTAARRGPMRPATDDDRKRLKVPPAYTDLQVTDDPDADLVGLAKKPDGSDFPVYSEAYQQRQRDAKWGRVAALDSDYEALSRQMDADIAAGGDDAGPAAALRLIRQTGMRNGGDGESFVPVLGDDGTPMRDAGGKLIKTKISTYGASNLRGTHVRVQGDDITLKFPGKKGVMQEIELTDPVLAKHLAPVAGKDQRAFDTTDARTLDYLTKISGDKYKVHDFRTLRATRLAAAMTESRTQPITDPKAARKYMLEVARPVSEQLGNTPAVCLENYIHPGVWAGIAA